MDIVEEGGVGSVCGDAAVVCAELFDRFSLGGGWWGMVGVLAHLGSGILAENLSIGGADQLVDLDSHSGLGL